MLVKCRECGEMISDLAKACPHCGCPAESRLSRMKACVPLKELATGMKRTLPRFRIRVPWSLIVPSVLANVLFAVLVIGTTISVSGNIRSSDVSVLVLIWGLWLAFAAVNLAVIMGSRTARGWLMVGMGGWLLVTLPAPIVFALVVIIEVPWLWALFSRSAQRWFDAHKRLDERRRKVALRDGPRT
jgi:hypothetical protein